MRSIEVFRAKTHELLEHPHSSPLARGVYCFIILTILLSVITLMFESIPSYASSMYIFDVIELVTVSIFTVELTVRFLVDSDKLRFFLNPLNFVDLLSILPIFIQVAMGSTVIYSFSFLRILRIMRVLRVLKLGKYASGLVLFHRTMQRSGPALATLSLVLLICSIVLSSIMFFVEEGAKDSQFTSIPHAIYWCMTTLSTVGYGDILPVTVGGQVVSIATMLAGVLVIAMPVTVIAANFHSLYTQWKQDLIAEAFSKGFPGCKFDRCVGQLYQLKVHLDEYSEFYAEVFVNHAENFATLSLNRHSVCFGCSEGQLSRIDPARHSRMSTRCASFGSQLNSADSTLLGVRNAIFDLERTLSLVEEGSEAASSVQNVLEGLRAVDAANADGKDMVPRASVVSVLQSWKTMPEPMRRQDIARFSGSNAVLPTRTWLPVFKSVDGYTLMDHNSLPNDTGPATTSPSLLITAAETNGSGPLISPPVAPPTSTHESGIEMRTLPPSFEMSNETLGVSRKKLKPLPSFYDKEHGPISLRVRVYEIFEYPESSITARIVSTILLLTILTSVLSFILETVPGLDSAENEAKWLIVETVCAVVFTIEILLRLWSAPSRLDYMFDILNIIDVVAVVPIYVQLAIGASDSVNLSFLRAIRIIRLFRVLKLGKYAEGLALFADTFRMSFPALAILAFLLLMFTVFFSSIIYYVERDENSDMFPSIPQSFYWCIATVTTVGYGDAFPKGVLGQIVSVATMLFGLLIIALPLTVIVAHFSTLYSQWEVERSHQKAMAKGEIMKDSDFVRFYKLMEDAKREMDAVPSENENVEVGLIMVDASVTLSVLRSPVCRRCIRAGPPIITFADRIRNFFGME